MSTFTNKKIAVVGSGLGGAFVTALLQASGYEVHAYEQAPAITRIGAGIHLSPNYVRALMHLGLFRQLTAIGYEPQAFVSRSLNDNRTLFRLPLGSTAWRRYGAPYMTIHRGDLHAALLEQIAPGTLHLNKRLSHIEESSQGVKLNFEDGTVERADAVVGADGLHSKAREVLRGPEAPTFGKHVAYRASVPVEHLENLDQYSLSKWWSDDRFLISYFMSDRRDIVYFAAGIPRDTWGHDRPWVTASREQLQKELASTTPSVAALTDHAEDISLWPLYQRPPIAEWGRGRIVLLGDACHPMQPHMAQGAAMATEDGALLTRFLLSDRFDKIEEAFAAYARYRIARTTRVQKISNANCWLRTPVDPDWLYGYNAMSCDLGLA